MAKPSPVGDQDRERVRELHAQGLSRNAIARQLGRSGRTVSRIAVELGLSFDRAPMVAAATEARKEDAKARRSALALALLDDAERLRGQMFAPAKAFNFGGKDNVYNETTLEEPTFADKRNIAQAVSTLLEKSIRLDAYDRETGSGTDVDRWLDAMTGGTE